ncbi:MAG: type III secretion system inner membrane ring subunit SctD [Simkaniaceae bacterium]|nr:type III secretion system inner membrane ring subunit SctD [Simkaniaceae bacterium]
MIGFLIAEEGSQAGLTIRLAQGDEWIIGRDPDHCFRVIEDPMVSRKHAIIRLTENGHHIENLSAVNPTTVNERVIDEPTLLREGDFVQIGNVLLRYTRVLPEEPFATSETLTEGFPNERQGEEETPTIFDDADEAGSLTFAEEGNARRIIKIIAGPNAGGEFGLHEGETHVIGKNPDACDIVFQDLSVSRRHAEIVVSEERVTIRDLGSRNKILVNGVEISDETVLESQDLVSLGTTSFLLIDRKQTTETIVSPPADPFGTQPDTPPGEPADQPEEESPEVAESSEREERERRKDLIIPTRHLALAVLLFICVIAGLGGMLSLFKEAPVSVVTGDHSQEIEEALRGFPAVEFSFNAPTEKLFLLGNVLTETDHREMLYMLKSLPCIKSIEDNVIIDELVWGGINAILAKNPEWRGTSLSSTSPGHFVLRGYVRTPDESTRLDEYMHLHFPYLDRLKIEIITANTLETEVKSLLLTKNLANVAFRFTGGELILSGRIGSDQESHLTETVREAEAIEGVRNIRNFVVITAPTNATVDLSSKYKVTGTSKRSGMNQYVVINGKILSKNDLLDGMMITDIGERMIFLKKDGIKYRINYNQQ